MQGFDRLVITADPVTFTEEDIAAYTVAVNCNDIVAMGGIPRYLTTTILAPTGTTREKLQKVFSDLQRVAQEYSVLWVGGHTEITTAVVRMVISGQLIGFLRREPTPSSGARPGDLLVMTKWAGLEGTTVIAKERPAQAKEILGSETYGEVLKWLDEPGISIVKEGTALESVALSSGHDPTEGGLATGIREIVTRSGVGAVIRAQDIVIKDETRKLCDTFGLDPLGLLSSGVLLFTASPADATQAVELLARQGIPASAIGQITDREGQLLLRSQDAESDLPYFERDEIIRLLD